MLKSVVILSIALLFAACDTGKIQEEANKQFGDQHFKTAIALIELHKIRFGEYPVDFGSLKYLGDWDRIGLTSVKYQKLDSGYSLDLLKGFSEIPKTLQYPDEFWAGLGLVSSNMKK